ncbi:MAG: tRNA (adenosine(37)-N6)-threonylcarbamoyltransferase complex transferase subunit TsaD [Terracidiphilus sp.]
MSGRGLILAIESSCDETAAAIVERGARTLSSVVSSQIATHARYGGVVPELASREHLRAIVPVVRAALAQAGVALADLDAIAVTSGPGLAGALLVGITYAKALAFAQNLPLIAVNHLEGHIHAVLLNERESLDGQRSPDSESALALVVSGGHTHLYLARTAHNSWSYSLIGRTLDDAAGEAFDKVAKLLGFGYPGGPWIDALARFGNPLAVPFSFSQIKRKVHLGGNPPRTKAARTAPIANLDSRFLFSFSGIKTAVLRYVELRNLRPEAQARAARLFPAQVGQPVRNVAESKELQGAPSFPLSSAERVGDHKPQPSSVPPKPPATREEALALCPQLILDLIASFQHAVVGDLMKKTFAAAESLGARRILITGGVAANRELRQRFTAEAARRGVRLAFPTLALSTDNAAMIAAAAWPRLLSGDFAPPDLSADPSLALGR